MTGRRVIAPVGARMVWGFLKRQFLDRATSVVNVNVVNKERKTPVYTGVYLGSCKPYRLFGFCVLLPPHGRAFSIRMSLLQADSLHSTKATSIKKQNTRTIKAIVGIC
jgi:hypothetical protein